MVLISLSFKTIYKPTNNNLRTSSNTSRASQDNTLRINRGAGYDNQKVVNVVRARENVGTQVVQQSKIQFYNSKEYGHVARECVKLKRAKDAAYHKEKMLFCDTNFTIYSLDISTNREIVHQDDDDLARESDLLASLIEKLKCEINDSKNHNKFLESSNKALVDKLKDLKKFQPELDRYHDVNYASKVEIDCATAKEPTMVSEDDKMSKEKEIDKLMVLISLSFKTIYKPTNNNLRTSSNTSRASQDNTPRINRGAGYDNQKVVNVIRARENVGTQVSAEQADWRDDTDYEPDDQELEAHYLYMAKIQEVTPDVVDNSGPILNAEPLQKVQNNDDNYNLFANDREHPEQPKSVNDTYLVE
nr:hypothetical protein [Tanacetum cinerariifolium]